MVLPMLIVDGQTMARHWCRPIRLLVCGGRGFRNWTVMNHVLSVIHEQHGGIHTLIEGEASGADTGCRLWAEQYAGPAGKVIVEPYRVDHDLDGPWPAAGVRRNSRMLASSNPDMGLCFPGGKGTSDMRAKLVRDRIETYDVSNAGELTLISHPSSMQRRLL